MPPPARLVVPAFALRVLLVLTVFVFATGVLLTGLHGTPSIPFQVLSLYHSLWGLGFAALGLGYLASHTRRIGAPRHFPVVLALWTLSLFGLPFSGVPFLAVTVINTVAGGALVLYLWRHRRVGQHWSSWASAAVLMVTLAGLISTGFLMTMEFSSLRSQIYRHAHLALTPILPLLLLAHARARRRAGHAGPRFELGRAWYVGVVLFLAVHGVFFLGAYNKRVAMLPEDPIFSASMQTTLGLDGRSPWRTGVLDDRVLQASASCGVSGCHLGPYRQWRGSLHRFSATNIAFTSALESFKGRNGAAAEAFCATCHNPLAVATGAFERGDRAAIDRHARDGVDCETCHLQARPATTDPAHAMFFRSFPDTPYPWVESRPDLFEESRSYLRRDTFFHRRKYADDHVKTQELCGACHVERIETPDGLELEFFDQLAGHAASGLGERGITCRKCHAVLHRYPHLEEGSVHARPDHRFPGIALDLPDLVPAELLADEPGLAEDLAETAGFIRSWLDGRADVSDYERVYLKTMGDPQIVAFEELIEGRAVLDVALALAEVDGAPALVVTTTNWKVGHDFPSGPPDLIQVWLTVEIQQPGASWRGWISDDATTGVIDARAPRLGGRVLDADGRELREHAIDLARSLSTWRIPFGESVRHEISLAGSGVTAGDRLRATWRYRRLNPTFSRWAFDDPEKLLATHDLAHAEIEVKP